MGEWTIEQWVAAIVVWLWGTWISGKVVDGAPAIPGLDTTVKRRRSMSKRKVLA